MALPATDPAARLAALLAREEPKLRRALNNALAAAAARGGAGRLEELIASGRSEEALQEALTAGLVDVADEHAAVYSRAGASAAAAVSSALNIAVDFDAENLNALASMRRSRLELIREFTGEQRRAVRAALAEGTRLGENPKAQARRFREAIGLTARQEAAVRNYRGLLEAGSAESLARELRDRRFDPTVRRAIRSGEPLSSAQVDRMVGRYRSRFLRHRSETIARTEALRAVHEGNREAFEQAYDSGALDRDSVTRTWVTARDERVRGSHAAMGGQSRPAEGDEPFVSGNGNRLRYPGDPSAPASETVRCRCVVATRMDAPPEDAEPGPSRGPVDWDDVQEAARTPGPLDVVPPQVGLRVETLLMRGLSNREVADAVLREFPGASTTPKSVASIKSRLKASGARLPTERTASRQSDGSRQAVEELQAGLPPGVRAPESWAVFEGSAQPGAYSSFVPGKGVVFNDASMRALSAQQARQVAAHELGHFLHKQSRLSPSLEEMATLRFKARSLSGEDSRRYSYYLVNDDELVAEVYSQALSPSAVTSQGLDAARFNSIFADDIAAAKARLTGRKPKSVPKSAAAAAPEEAAAAAQAKPTRAGGRPNKTSVMRGIIERELTKAGGTSLEAVRRVIKAETGEWPGGGLKNVFADVRWRLQRRMFGIEVDPGDLIPKLAKPLPKVGPVSDDRAHRAVAAIEMGPLDASDLGRLNASQLKDGLAELTEAEYGAVRSYTGQSFLAINEALRRGASGSAVLTDYVATVRSALGKLQPAPGTVFRGVGTHQADMDSIAATYRRAMESGRALPEPAFVSASRVAGRAREFGSSMSIEIRHKGSFRMVSGVSLQQRELEALAAPGVRFKVLEVEEKKVSDRWTNYRVVLEEE